MATPLTAQVKSSADIKWASGALFNGFVVLTMSSTVAGLKNSRPQIRVPYQVKIPIREGVYEVETKIWRTDALVPANVTYSASFYDMNGTLVATGATGQTVTADPFTLATPTLPDPT